MKSRRPLKEEFIAKTARRRSAEAAKTYIPRVVFHLLALLLIGLPLRAQTLNYAEGADPTDDPATTDSVPPADRRYVDDVTGRDANDGKSPRNAWKTLARVNESAASFRPGTYVLFKRGGTFEGQLNIGDCRGGPGQRIVFGAYGPGHNNGDGDPFNDLRPRLASDDTSVQTRKATSLALGTARWVMIRDLDTGKIAGSPSDTVLFNNVIHGSGHSSNVVKLSNNAARCAIVQNLVYDCAANDLVTLHSGPSQPPSAVESSHWIVDNVIVGNAGAESGIDLQVGEQSRGEPITDDFKVIGNRVQMQAGTIPGLRQRHTGRGTAGIEGGHSGRHIWILGNFVAGASKIGLKSGGFKSQVQIGGNVIWRSGGTSNTAECTTDDVFFEHNTIIHTGEGRHVLLLKDNVTQLGQHFQARRWIVRRNLFLRTHAGSWFGSWSSGPEAITAMDRNWYSAGAGGSLNGMPLEEWQKASRHDLNSFAGVASGVSLPPATVANENPMSWFDGAFLRHFTPAPDWRGNDVDDGRPAGAIGSDGRWHGGGPWGAGKWNPAAMRPFATLKLNGGYGWEGPLIVQQRYPLPSAGASRN